MTTIFEEAISLRALVRVAADYAERNAIIVALSRCEWNKTKTAKMLSISIVSLVNKIRYHHIERNSRVVTEPSNDDLQV